MTLVIAHTRKMNSLEQVMSNLVSRSGGFLNMTEAQEEQHSELAAQWDKMKSDREMAKLVDAGKMTIVEFNTKKLTN